jgi:drug/metabolite transporter (DMT)-like permease
METEYILVAIFISFWWGISPIILKGLVTKFDVMTIMVLEGILYFAFVILMGIRYYDTIMIDAKRANAHDWSMMFLTAVVGGFIANVIYMALLEKHDSYIITALVSISPFFTLGLAYFFTKEKVTALGALGTIFIVLGILMISYKEGALRK